jgi:hypothetical protein
VGEGERKGGRDESDGDRGREGGREGERERVVAGTEGVREGKIRTRYLPSEGTNTLSFNLDTIRCLISSAKSWSSSANDKNTSNL